LKKYHVITIRHRVEGDSVKLIQKINDLAKAHATSCARAGEITG
jgi:hypothetical protein